MLIKFAVQDFLEDKKYKNLSTKTIEGYKRSLNMFHEYCVKQEVLNVEDIRPMTIKSFLIHLEAEHGNNATSRNNKLRIVKNFMSWCQDNELISDKQNVAKKVNYAREEIILKPFSDAQINQMLSYLRSNKQRERTFLSYRNYIIIVFLLGTGVRLGELISITWNDMDLKNGSASILGKKRELSSVPLTDKLIKEMAE
ncbi:integrase/recombinase XerD [Fontibacillus solani]|uniref:Integrase/recombinase XerD n=1 Tax=Fontibacillus solani TaxID=1572857 RepID=A0A7W3SY16_9BACL|nr:tyrosine-type recombinase/integrase [Fontibacillus solani]MBA9088043.1 integrase/recombinase XerD [Fontibacillus solani]